MGGPQPPTHHGGLRGRLSCHHRPRPNVTHLSHCALTIRKLFLVGFAMIIMKDTLEQLAFGLIFTLIHMLLMATKQPYRQLDNDYFALACNFGLTVTFFFTLVLKVTNQAMPHITARPPVLGCSGLSLGTALSS